MGGRDDFPHHRPTCLSSGLAQWGGVWALRTEGPYGSRTAFSRKWLRMAARFILRATGSMVGLVLLITVWQVLALWLPSTDLASPLATVSYLVGNYSHDAATASFGLGGGLASLLYFSVRNVLLGSVLGGVAGLVLGLVLARSALVRAAAEPVLITLGTVPILVVMPMFVIWFGVASYTAAALVGMYVTIVVAQYSLRAADNVPPIYEEAAATFGAGPVTRMRRVLVPAVLPEALAGFRVAIAFSWGLEVFAETLGAPSGLGQGTAVLAEVSDVQGILAIVLLVAAAALAMDAVLIASSRFVFRWRESYAQA